jgi:hypothetical protein
MTVWQVTKVVQLSPLSLQGLTSLPYQHLVQVAWAEECMVWNVFLARTTTTNASASAVQGQSIVNPAPQTLQFHPAHSAWDGRYAVIRPKSQTN